MTWIDDTIEEAKEFRRHEQVRRNGALPMYRDLRNEIHARIKELAGNQEFRGLVPLLANVHIVDSEPHDFLVSIAHVRPGESSSNRKELHLRIDRKWDQAVPSIEASSSVTSTTFEFEVVKEKGKERVSLTHMKRCISIEDAARLILRPFFFPELQQQT
jgi:hypothetical protein